jgi:hypothetical protein
VDGSWWWTVPVPAWFGLAVLLLGIDVRPRRPAGGPDPELPPALVEYLNIRCQSSLVGVAATVHDLIGRGHLLLVPGDPDCVLRARRRPDQLRTWEVAVLDLLEGRELPGVGVPLAALISGDRIRVDLLIKEFQADVDRAALAAGLVRPRLTVPRGTVLAVAGVVAAALTCAWGGSALLGVLPIALPVLAGLLGAMFVLGGRRLTAHGREVLQALRRWSAEREHQESDPGTRAYAEQVALGLVGPEQHLVWTEPAGTVWSPASGRWQRVGVEDLAGRAAGPDSLRIAAVVVGRRLVRVQHRYLPEEFQWWIAVDDGRSGTAVGCRCSDELYVTAQLGTWLGLELDPATGWVGEGRLLPAEALPGSEPGLRQRAPAAGSPRWSEPSAPGALLDETDIGSLARRPVTVAGTGSRPDEETTWFRIGGTPGGEVSLTVITGRSARELGAGERISAGAQGGEATLVGAEQIVLLSVTGPDRVIRQELAEDLCDLLANRLGIHPE